MTGYSDVELDEIQHRWKLTFPPDLVAHLRRQRSFGKGADAFDWLTSGDQVIQARLNWPFESFLFDVEHDQLWWPEWGPRPDSAPERRAPLAKAFAAAPKLIPLFGHRYLPADPCEPGNPVFSVYQSDVIYCGANLQDWLRREIDGWDSEPWPPIKRIRFWFDAEERNGQASRSIPKIFGKSSSKKRNGVVGQIVGSRPTIPVYANLESC